MADFFSLTIKEEFLLDVFFVIRQKLLSTKVCEVPEELEVELELLAESSFFEQEMRVRLKNADRKMKIILFINQLITKVKYYGLVLKNFELYQNMWCFTRIWDFTSWRVPDCEELVGPPDRRDADP